MRLYLKLALMLCVAAAAQSMIDGRGRDGYREAWFALRCQVAYVTADDALRLRLVEEARQVLAARGIGPPAVTAAAGA